MKTGPAPKYFNAVARSDRHVVSSCYVAVQVCPRSEAVVFGTLRATRKEARGALANLLMNEVDASSDMPSIQRGFIRDQVQMGTHDRIIVGCRRFRIVPPRVSW